MTHDALQYTEKAMTHDHDALHRKSLHYVLCMVISCLSAVSLVTLARQINSSELYRYQNCEGPLARKAEAKILRFGSNFNFSKHLRITIAGSVAI
jgi:hypothetical protein